MKRNTATAIAALLVAAAPALCAPLAAQDAGAPGPGEVEGPVLTAPAAAPDGGPADVLLDAPLDTPLIDPAALPVLAPPASLAELIPDEAVANPESWAASGVPAEAAALALNQPDVTEPELAADAPLAELPEITLPWPEAIELPQLAELEPDEDIQFAEFGDVLPQLPAGTERRVSDELVLSFPTDAALFPYTGDFLDRFKSLSAVETMGDEGSVARLAAQAREDEALLGRMLRVYGYYDAQVIRSVSGIQPGEVEAEATSDAAAEVRFDIIPGPQYLVGTVDLGALAETGADYAMLRETYGVQPGDPLLMDKVDTERFDLDLALGENGYPFAAITEPSILVDHARREGDVTMPVAPGGKYNFGMVTSSMPGFLSGEHLAEIARFDPGDLYMRSDETDLRKAILATGIVGTVTITPVAVKPPVGDQPGTVDIAVDLTKAPLRTLAGSIGYGTGEGIRLEGSWEHRNLFPPEGLLRVRAVAGTQEQLAGVTFRKNNFHGRDRILTGDFFVSNVQYDAYDAQTISLIGTYEQLSTLLFQKEFSWGTGIEVIATRETERKIKIADPPSQDYFVGALPSYVQFDTSESLLDPTEGFRLRAAVSPEISRSVGETSKYLKVQFDLAKYQTVSEGIVLAGRVRVGSINGADITAIAPSRRFYAGGGGSVRGYGYKSIGPQDRIGEPNGGRSLLELSAEARIRTGLMGGAISVVPFVDAGTVATGTIPDFSEIKVGVGVGARYHSSFGPIRLDIGVPLNKGPDDGWVAVYVALGQAF